MDKTAKRLFFLFVLIITFYFFKAILSPPSSTQESKEKSCPPVGTIKRSFYGHCPENFQKLQILEMSMKNPKSFEVIYTEQLEGGRLKVKYRATNGFGATVTETKIIN